MTTQPLYNPREIIDLKDLLYSSEKLFGEKTAFKVKTDEQTIIDFSYSEFTRDVEFLGTALISLGLKDSFVAIIGENRYEWCVSYLSVTNGTGVVVPLDKELPFDEIVNLLSRSEAAAIIFTDKYSESVGKYCCGLDTLKFKINIDAESDTEDYLSYKKLLAKGRELIDSGDRSFVDAVIDAEKLNILLFTSGTTAMAKAVMLSHKNICSDIVNVNRMIYMDQNDSVVSILPLHHTYECTAGFLLMIYNGASIAFNDTLKNIGKNIREYQPTILVLVPLILENMFKRIQESAKKTRLLYFKFKFGIFICTFVQKVFKKNIGRKLFSPVHEGLGGRLRLVVSGAAAVEPSVSKALGTMGFKILQGYGLTECSPIAAVNLEFNYRDSAIGLPLANVEMEIVNPDENGIGEITVQGENVMLGYYKNEEATKEVLRDGVLYTGDLGYVDKDGFFYITGRKKNVIVTKNGKNIFPEEVESTLNKSPFILESLVFGKSDSIAGETKIMAKIVPDMDAIKVFLKKETVSDQDVSTIIQTEITDSNHKMSSYKAINDFVIQYEELVKTTTKKIKRNV